MKKRIIGLTVSLLAVCMLATPVFAIGPQNAVKNPNADNVSPLFALPWAQFLLPNGQFTEWVPSADLGTTILFQHKNADDFQIRNAMQMTIAIGSVDDMMVFYGAENKWIFLSQNSYYNYLFNSFVQFGPDAANAIATYYSSMYENGLYIRFVVVGK